MLFDQRWKNPQGKDVEALWRWAQDLTTQLRSGQFLSQYQNPNAAGVPYSNTASGLTATQVQAAIDEVEGRLDTAEATLAAAPWKWKLIAQRTVSGDETFTGLAGYSELRAYLAAVTTSSAAVRQLQASTDNGSTWLTASGDYIAIDYLGQPSNVTAIPCHVTANTAARYGEIIIRGCNLTAPKVATRTNGEQDQSTADERTMWVIPVASAINALRINATAGNLNGGTIYLYGR